MILTVTLNASLDKRYIIEDLKLSNLNRVSIVKNSAGGKGVNVSRVLTILDCDNLSTGIVGGKTGELIIHDLNKDNIKNDYYLVEDESRTSIHVLSKNSMKETDILENGVSLKNGEVDEFIDKYIKLLDDTDIVVLGGSVPPGFKNDIYFELISIAKKHHAKTILDTSKEYLKEAVNAKPYLIKPNKAEFEEFIGYSLNDMETIKKAAIEVINSGIENIIISDGEKGIYYFNKNNGYYVSSPKVELKNSVGSGDALVAGFIYGLKNNYNIIDTLKFAVACGAENAMEERTGFINKDNLAKLIGEIKVDEIK